MKFREWLISFNSEYFVFLSSLYNCKDQNTQNYNGLLFFMGVKLGILPKGETRNEVPENWMKVIKHDTMKTYGNMEA
jgi:hypothetical protein